MGKSSSPGSSRMSKDGSFTPSNVRPFCCSELRFVRAVHSVRQRRVIPSLASHGRRFGRRVGRRGGVGVYGERLRWRGLAS